VKDATEVAARELAGWDLSELLPDASEATVEARLAELEQEVRELESWRGRLSAEITAADLIEMLRRSEAVVERASALGAYGSLWFSADTQSPAALAYRNRVQQVLTAVQNRLLFLELWWKSLEDANAERLLGGLAGHPDYVQHLRDLRRLRPHTLEERSEQIINLKDADGIGAVLTAYSILTNRLEFQPDGEGPKLTRDELAARVFSPRAEERAAAYRELHRVYGQEATLLGQLYVHRARDWHNENVALRGYPGPLEVRNVANDIPDPAVEALLEVCREGAPLFQRYFRLKAQWLGSGRLSRYDLYAPVAESRRDVPYRDAVETVLGTLRDFHPRFGEAAEQVLAERHLDGAVRKGKRGGAFCATVSPRFTPWVLVNYTGRQRDVATLAHELGHAVHSQLASGHSILVQQPSLPLAEPASVFAEMLLTERLVREESDPAARRELLVAAVDDVYATVLRQAYFVLFERQAHAAVMAGRSSEELGELYLGLLREQFGDAVEVPDEFRHEWLSIPHLYQTPFYCYAYSFGQLLVLALYRRYRQEGESFKPGYLRLLSWGGAARPFEILAEAGIDPSARDFWRQGLAVVREMIEDLETGGRPLP